LNVSLKSWLVGTAQAADAEEAAVLAAKVSKLPKKRKLVLSASGSTPSLASAAELAAGSASSASATPTDASIPAAPPMPKPKPVYRSKWSVMKVATLRTELKALQLPITGKKVGGWVGWLVGWCRRCRRCLHPLPLSPLIAALPAHGCFRYLQMLNITSPSPLHRSYCSCSHAPFTLVAFIVDLFYSSPS
jgi:hypothetical protein